MNASANFAAIIAVELSEKLAMIVGTLQREPRMGNRWNLLRDRTLLQLPQDAIRPMGHLTEAPYSRTLMYYHLDCGGASGS